MMAWMSDASPRVRARITGGGYLLMFLWGGFSTLARRGIVVREDPLATVTNIMAHKTAWWAGYAGDLLLVASYLVVVAFLYDLFKPVNRRFAFLAACFGLLGCAIQSAGTIFEVAPLTVLGGAKFLSVFSPDQLRGLACLFMRFYNLAYGVALVFFAFAALINGILILRSTFLPRVVGALMVLAGLGWMTFLAPPFATKYFPIILALGIGEGVLMVWLLVAGVNVQRWNEKAAAAGIPVRT
jgi:uncharacterized protein DUF4386